MLQHPTTDFYDLSPASVPGATYHHHHHQHLLPTTTTVPSHHSLLQSGSAAAATSTATSTLTPTTSLSNNSTTTGLDMLTAIPNGGAALGPSAIIGGSGSGAARESLPSFEFSFSDEQIACVCEVSSWPSSVCGPAAK